MKAKWIILLLWILSCGLAFFLGWRLRQGQQVTAMDDWSVPVSDSLQVRALPAGSERIEVLVADRNGAAVCNMGLAPETQVALDVTVYDTPRKRIALSASCYPDGAVRELVAYQAGKRSRAWRLRNDGALEYLTVYTNNVGHRQFLDLTGTVTNSRVIQIHHP